MSLFGSLRLLRSLLLAPVAGLREERLLLEARRQVYDELGEVYDRLRASYGRELAAMQDPFPAEDHGVFAAERAPWERRLKELKARYAELDAEAPEWAIR